MPLNSTSESPYPINELKNELAALASPPPPYSAVNTNKFFALDLKENNEANHSTKDKRKFISVNLLDNKLQIVSYSNKDLAKVLESNKKEEIFLVFYVKTSEKNEFEKEVKNKLSKLAGLNIQEKIDKIKEHFQAVWKNFTSFPNYHNILEAYDQRTGEPILKAVNKSGEIYFDIKKRYDDLKKQYGERPEKYQKILTELEVMVGNMKKEYEDNRDKFQHLSIDTISPVNKSLQKKKEEFGEKSKQLKVEDSNDERNEKLGLLQKEITALQDDCKNAISPEAAYPQAIFKEKDEIIKDTETLLQYSKSLKNLITSKDEINGLQIKLNELKDKFANLNARILPGTVKQDTQEDISLKEVESSFEKLQGLLVELKTYETKGDNKKEIKEELIQKIDNILKLNKQCSPEELGNAIFGANQFIENNKDKASEYTGGFFGKVLGEGHSKLGAIVEKLQRLFAEFLSKLSFNQPNASIDATPKTFGRG